MTTTQIRVERMDGGVVEILHPGTCRGHVVPGEPAAARAAYNYTQRGYAVQAPRSGAYYDAWARSVTPGNQQTRVQAPRSGAYYDAWYVVDGEIFLPIGDKWGHRPAVPVPA